MANKKHICIVTTLWSSINNWIKPFLSEYNKRGIDVTIVCNMDNKYEANLKKDYPFVYTHSIDFPRGMSVLGSLKSIWKMYKFLKKEKFDLIQYSTPNASFYSAVASKFADIPVRLYCQWGMVYVTKQGLARKFTETIERITCKYSTMIQPDSDGNLQFCRANRLYDASKSCVIWKGSAKGLDLGAYNILRKGEFALEIRKRYNIPEGRILGFVGRLGREKGCNELFRAYRELKKKYSDLTLLFVGPIEKEESIEPELLQYFSQCDSIIKTGRVPDVPKHMAAMDICILPSYREGFGMSVVEASAMGVPVIATKYPGPSSAMRHKLTGFEINVASVGDIIESVIYLLENPEEAKRMGENGRKFAEENFEQKRFIRELMENRMQLLGLK